MKKKQLLREKSSEIKPSYFELQAYWGATKHMGGLKATNELVKLCHINNNKYVLDVGCGVGVTACYIAKKHGCKVVGVDISKKMIDKANKRAKRGGIEDKVKFIVADAQALPFKNSIFDVVISESVTTFIKNKQKAIGEYARVTKQGGYVGLNEEIWLKTPTKELVKYASRTWDIKTEILTSNDWKKLLKDNGLRNIVAKTYKFEASLNEYINETRLYIKDFPRMLYKALSLYIKSPKFRKYIKERFKSFPKHFFEYLGYGIYVGRK